MPTRKNESAAEIVKTELPEFEVVKKARPDTPYLPPDSKTPGVKQLHRKYHSDSSAEESVLTTAEPPSNPAATQAVVVEPKDRPDARTTKRLTVLVKRGKIRAIQG
jgi:hypothetical protein